ncbi:hypothetical protein ScPMuIL_013616 [Solemya velum]
MAVAGVNVSVEAVLENQIQEVSLDGQEIYVPPLSMSENLTKQAHKIDFYRDETEEKGKPASEGEQDSGEKTLTPFQPSLWPWDSVRNKLKAAFTEVSVLLDVLNIVKEKHYMVLDQVSQGSQDSMESRAESRPGVHMLSKKRSLLSAANILMAGSERLRRSQSQAESTIKSQSDFHIELLKLRQNWRLRKVGSAILGDLSYKSAGSRFLQSGTFEVVKCSGENSIEQEGSAPRMLEVVIPSELEGVAYIQVEVKPVPDAMDLTSAILKMPAGLGQVPTDAYWQQKLEVAQNVLFCKELFAQLAREAVHAKTSSPHLVVGNQIITNVFPGIQLSIVLCHSTGKDKKGGSGPHKLEHNHVLEHSLHQLLREVHYKAINHPPPHPVIGTLGVSKRRRMAGPSGMSRSELQQMMESESLLEQIIKQTRHEVLRLRTMKVLDRLSARLSDPLVACHWSCLNSSLQSVVKVMISSYGYEYRMMSQSFILMIGVGSIKAITKEGRTFCLSFEGQDLEDLVMWQLSQHHTIVAQTLGKMMGWHLLSHSGNCGVGDMETVGTASSIMLAPPGHNRVLSVKSGPSRGMKVCVKSLQKEGLPSLSAVTDPKWKVVGGDFQDIDLDKIDGRNVAAKLELLMATLSKAEPH